MRILIADSDPDFCGMLCAKLARKMPAARIETVSDGLELLRMAETEMPGLIVINVLLPGRDGLAVMQAIRAMERCVQPEFIVLSGYFSQQIQQDLCRLRPAYFTPVPCDADLLSERIMRCCNQLIYRQARQEADEAQAITHLLREMGLSMSCKGFRYFREALRRIMENPECNVCVTKTVYPAVAAAFHTTAVNVERAMRSAILTAWRKDGYLRQQELFRERPTNSEFLAVLSEELQKERHRRGQREELDA